MDEFRCACHKLLFKVNGNTITIKCRCCKRYIRVKTHRLIKAEFRSDERISYGKIG